MTVVIWEVGMMRIGVGLAVMLHASAALACLGMDSEDYTLLDALPAAAMEQDVVAEVALAGAPPEHDAIAVQMRVVRGIKGVKKGEVLQVQAYGSSCSHLSQRARQGLSGELADGKATYFIAGEVVETAQGARVFVGSWKGDVRADKAQ